MNSKSIILALALGFVITGCKDSQTPESKVSEETIAKALGGKVDLEKEKTEEDKEKKDSKSDKKKNNSTNKEKDSADKEKDESSSKTVIYAVIAVLALIVCGGSIYYLVKGGKNVDGK